ncbi:MAG: RluA family pseudouridine synthase [Lachnospiraceae bacterium]|nr:RluA family pseudouridine synthase [Lachnospiraceae bacterium]
MQKITVSHAEAGRRLDNYLIKALPGGGLSFVHKMLRKKNITVNGRKCEGNYRLAEGDEICMFFSDETYSKLLKERPDPTSENDSEIYKKAYASIHGIEIVYEDDDFIFIDKPSGVLSQQGSTSDLSVNEWLVGYLMDKGVVTADSLKTFKPAFANRLDRNTSGLMLGGRSLKSLQLLSEMLRDRSLQKYYLCLAEGHPDDRLPVTEDGYTEIYGYLVKDHDRNTVKVYRDKAEALKCAGRGASEIHTGFRLVRLSGDDRMVLEVELYTGKSHQIRAQLSALGHPITGDPKYGSSNVRSADSDRSGRDKNRGQLLHAYRVVFPELPGWPAVSGREFRTKRYKEGQYA